MAPFLAWPVSGFSHRAALTPKSYIAFPPLFQFTTVFLLFLFSHLGLTWCCVDQWTSIPDTWTIRSCTSVASGGAKSHGGLSILTLFSFGFCWFLFSPLAPRGSASPPLISSPQFPSGTDVCPLVCMTLRCVRQSSLDIGQWTLDIGH